MAVMTTMTRVGRYPRKLSFVVVFYVAVLIALLPQQAAADYKILINHLTTDLAAIPLSEIASLKANLHIAYQHTSHGSQLISGMNTLENHSPFGTTYQWSDDGSAGLDLDDYGIPGIADLSQGDYIDENGVTPWVTATRNLLDNPANGHINVIMWSWCDIGGHDIARYIENMELLIAEYGEGGSKPRAAINPVTFVFMTGHANGGGEGDSSDSRNQLIRQHCFDNERVLFDFADIENYDPAGNYYLDKRVTDDLDYDNIPPYDSGGRDGNWAIEYLDANAGSELDALTDLCTSCAHSFDDQRKGLNCVLKGRAAWWMFARINGWDGGFCTLAPSGLTAIADSVGQAVTLSWTDNSGDEDSYILQRQQNGGAWDTSYQVLPAGSTGYIDTSLAPGVYSYRVLAHRDDNGSGSPCDSSYSNSATAVLATGVPAAPSVLDSTVLANTISLSWQDNSDNEQNFILERMTGGGSWTQRAVLSANTVSFDDSGLTVGVSYSYRVKAANSYGESAYSNISGKCICAVTTTVRLQSTGEVDDAFLVAASPDTNYGATNYLSDTQHFIIKFNLPAEVLQQKIVEARLGLYVWNVALPAPPHYFHLYSVTGEWAEAEVTWNNGTAALPWSTPGGDFTTPPYTSIEITDIDHAFLPAADITELVQQWADRPALNHGLILVKDPAATAGLKASEYSDNQRPYLEITYSPAIPGDLNDDGSVTLADTIIGLQQLCPAAGAAEVTLRADVDGDGRIGLAETLYILGVQQR